MKIYLNSEQNETLSRYEKFTQPSSLRWAFAYREEQNHGEDGGYYYVRVSKLEFHPYADDVDSSPCWILGDLMSFIDNCIKQGYLWDVRIGQIDHGRNNSVSYTDKVGEKKVFNTHDELIDNIYDAIISFLNDLA